MKLLPSTSTFGLGTLLTGLVLSCSGSDGHPPVIRDKPTETGEAGEAAGGTSSVTGGGSKATGGKASRGGDTTSMGGDDTLPSGGGGMTTSGGKAAMGGSGGSAGMLGQGGSGGSVAGAGGKAGGGAGSGGAGGMPLGGAGGMPPGGAGGMPLGGAGGMPPGGAGGMPPGGMGGMGIGGMGGGAGGKGGNGGASGGNGGASGAGTSGSAGANGGSAGSSGSAGSGGSGDPCVPNPCLHAGTCSNVADSAVCTCKGAWDGVVCDDIYFGDPTAQNDARMADSTASCNEDSFLDLTDWLPDPNSAYADPTLSVSCNGSIMSVTSNSVPQYKIDWSDPKRTSYANTLIPTTTTYSIPKNPVFNAVPKQATVVGGVGVAVNGVQISLPSASGGPLHYADPDSIEVDGDTCDGHPNPQGKYHYHALTPRCLYKNAENGDLAGDACSAPSPIIGWIADGYPIYGPCECLDKDCTQVVEMRSSYALMGGDDDPSECAYQDFSFVGAADEYADGDEYLDECSGHIGPNGDYHYHMTNEYPWTLRCYRGNPMTTMAIGHTYNNAAGGNDCCFEKECVGGVFQDLGCMAASCTP